METTIRLGEPHDKTELIYEVFDQFEGYPGEVKVQVEYSGAANEEDIEFEWTVVRDYDNPHLNETDLIKIQKILECGREEDYIRLLEAHYSNTNINFLHHLDGI